MQILEPDRWVLTAAGLAALAAPPAVPVAALRALLAELDGWPERPTNFGDARDRLSALLAEYAGDPAVPDRDAAGPGR